MSGLTEVAHRRVRLWPIDAVYRAVIVAARGKAALDIGDKFGPCARGPKADPRRLLRPVPGWIEELTFEPAA